ncbi:DUF6252 family protein [Flavobacterium sp. WC2421]|jgi:hypothetical protein|uniref:DUF6252 family protein n=3 Tax=unclassified Flavobacterium TaxID=196869 RepID=A0AB39WD41_9FLAO
MKKHFLFIIVLFSVISCQEDIRFNNPSFQGVKDNVFWRAIQTKASLGANGSLIIEAYSGNEVVTFKTTSKLPQTYLLGTSSSKTATYVLTDSNGSITFATGSGIGDGQIKITEYDAVSNTVSGTFKFNAENIYNNPLAGPVLNFQQGVFYKIPITTTVQ